MKRPTLHVIGPDDLIAFPNIDQAVDACAGLEIGRADPIPYWGEVIEWPHESGWNDNLKRGDWKTSASKQCWNAYWVNFGDGKEGCIEARSREHAMKIARRFGRPIIARAIGYPATPRLTSWVNPSTGERCPTFCAAPQRCARDSETGCCCNPYGRSCSS